MRSAFRYLREKMMIMGGITRDDGTEHTSAPPLAYEKLYFTFCSDIYDYEHSHFFKFHFRESIIQPNLQARALSYQR